MCNKYGYSRCSLPQCFPCCSSTPNDSPYFIPGFTGNAILELLSPVQLNGLIDKPVGQLLQRPFGIPMHGFPAVHFLHCTLQPLLQLQGPLMHAVCAPSIVASSHIQVQARPTEHTRDKKKKKAKST